MSDTDKALYDFIVAYVEKHGYAPTQSEMKSGIKASCGWTVSESLKHLKDKGYIGTDHPGAARALRINK